MVGIDLTRKQESGVIRIMDDQFEVMDWTAVGRRVRQFAELAARLHEGERGVGVQEHWSRIPASPSGSEGRISFEVGDLEFADDAVRGVRSEQ